MEKINLNDYEGLEGLGMLLRIIVDTVNETIDNVQSLDVALLELRKETI